MEKMSERKHLALLGRKKKAYSAEKKKAKLKGARGTNQVVRKKGNKIIGFKMVSRGEKVQRGKKSKCHHRKRRSVRPKAPKKENQGSF